jgi:hypothetical protein
MTLEELEQMKVVFKHLHDQIKERWLDQQILRNLIINSGWMSADDLDAGVANSRELPENIRQTEEHFAESEQSLAEIGLGDWLAQLEKLFPNTE